MSDEKKKPLLEVGVSSLLNVKAEIERALSESKSKSKSAGPKRKAAVTSDIRNKGVEHRAQKDLLSSQNDLESGSPSSTHVRQALEKKAKIYDALSSGRAIRSGVLDDDQMSKILDESSVDFVSIISQRLQQQEKQKTDSSHSGSSTRAMRSNEDDLVEVIDEFGRSRTVPRSKASEYGKMSASQQESSSSSDSSDLEGQNITTDAPLRRNQGTVHYHLSLNNTEREKQLQALRKLHDDTLASRERASASICQKQRLQLDQRRAQLRKSRGRAALRALQDQEALEKKQRAEK
ncbi:hypothetical protein LPJ64_002464 [Coemansia asiatica]|uniref:Uncharacterized protein n=1 Tax=Coemansia asiatica TaxID=1052880 RepID=A0A9W7XM21_9FUNG|nr:hypothetical protein LPJ64_002464 [Coemansia asiatica]KAJ2883870.1 hypothetical protein FB639_002076 [Coemansia asiatica]